MQDCRSSPYYLTFLLHPIIKYNSDKIGGEDRIRTYKHYLNICGLSLFSKEVFLCATKCAFPIGFLVGVTGLEPADYCF